MLLPPYTIPAFQEKYGLSKREMDIVNLFFQGKTNQEIADSLCLSVKAVKNHFTFIYEKTGFPGMTGSKKDRKLFRLMLDEGWRP